MIAPAPFFTSTRAVKWGLLNAGSANLLLATATFFTSLRAVRWGLLNGDAASSHNKKRMRRGLLDCGVGLRDRDTYEAGEL